MRSARQIWFCRIAALCVVALFYILPLAGLAVCLAWIIYVLGIGTWYQGYQGPSLERGLGFMHGKLYRRGTMQSALAIRSVVEGGVLAKAGFHPEDVLPDWSFTEFFRYLHRNRGQIVEFDVVDGNVDGPPFNTRPRKKLRFFVPTTSEAPATREDFLAAISIWSPFLFMAIAGTAGYFASQVILPAGPVWAQILIVCLSASAGCALGVHLAHPSHNAHSRC
jgi:hypothetical protein